MIAWLDHNLLYWHWVIFGIALVALELFTPTFVTLWLGVAAVIVGIVMIFIPLELSIELVIWITLSVLFLLLWHKFVSPRMANQTLAGLSKEAIIGQVGMVTFYNRDQGRGMLKFPAPILGNDDWEFIFDGVLENGDRVIVKDISGNSLIVRQQETNSKPS